MPPAPIFEWKWNITTILAVVNLAALVFFGGAGWSAIQTGLANGVLADSRQSAAIAEMREIFDARSTQIENMASQNEMRIRTLEIATGRSDEKLASILETVRSTNIQVLSLSESVNMIIQNRQSGN